MTELLTYEEAAQLLSIKRATLYSLVHHRRIPHVRLGPRFVRFSRAELEQWVAVHRVAEEA